PAGATVNVVAYWHLGENDPGAIAGNAVTNSINSAGTANLFFFGPPTYSADVATTAAGHADSSLSINLSNQAFERTNLISTPTDNFGIEAWVKPMAVNGTAQIIIYNGDTSHNGWGLILDSDNNYKGLFGGSDVIGAVPAQQGIWA